MSVPQTVSLQKLSMIMYYCKSVTSVSLLCNEFKCDWKDVLTKKECTVGGLQCSLLGENKSFPHIILCSYRNATMHAPLKNAIKVY